MGNGIAHTLPKVNFITVKLIDVSEQLLDKGNGYHCRKFRSNDRKGTITEKIKPNNNPNIITYTDIKDGVSLVSISG
jgi:3-hydroxyacyl-CoA dehydrogenase